jgi:hypothetical protein
MPDFSLSRYWDRQMEGPLPDCRLSYSNRERRTQRRGRMEMDVVFCGTCGQESGLVPVHCPHVYFLCDVCFAKMQGIPPPGMTMVT